MKKMKTKKANVQKTETKVSVIDSFISNDFNNRLIFKDEDAKALQNTLTKILVSDLTFESSELKRNIDHWIKVGAQIDAICAYHKATLYGSTVKMKTVTDSDGAKHSIDCSKLMNFFNFLFLGNAIRWNYTQCNKYRSAYAAKDFLKHIADNSQDYIIEIEKYKLVDLNNMAKFATKAKQAIKVNHSADLKGEAKTETFETVWTEFVESEEEKIENRSKKDKSTERLNFNLMYDEKAGFKPEQKIHISCSTKHYKSQEQTEVALMNYLIEKLGIQKLSSTNLDSAIEFAMSEQSANIGK